MISGLRWCSDTLGRRVRHPMSAVGGKTALGGVDAGLLVDIVLAEELRIQLCFKLAFSWGVLTNYLRQHISYLPADGTVFF